MVDAGTFTIDHGTVEAEALTIWIYHGTVEAETLTIDHDTVEAEALTILQFGHGKVGTNI